MGFSAEIDQSPRRALALSLGLFLFAVYLFFYRGGFHSVDEVSMFAVTESMVKFGRLDTDQIAWTQWTTSQAEAQGFFGQDGHVYSKKGLALSLAQAPLYWVALHLPGLGMLQTVSLLNAGVTAVTAVIVLLLLLRLQFDRVTAALSALLFGLATISFIYTKYLFSEPLAGLCLLLAAYWLLAYRQEGRPAWPALAGLAAGLAVLARANNLFLLPIFGLYLLWGAYRRAGLGRRLVPPLLAFGLAAGLVGAGLMAYNAARSGHPLQTGYDLTLFSPNIWLGLYKLLLSPLRGLFVYSPLLLLSLPGWWLLRQKHPAEAWLLAGLVGVTVALFSAWSSGEGLSWGSRFLVPIVPFLVICLAPVLVFIRVPSITEPSEKAPSHQVYRYALRFTFYTLLPLSLFIQILGVTINPWVFLARLQAEFGGEFFLENTAALYDFRYSQIAGQLQAWSHANSDLVWWQPWGFDGLAFGLGLALVVVSGGLLALKLRAALTPSLARLPLSPGERGPGGEGSLEQAAPMLVLLLAVAICYGLLARYYVSDRQFGPVGDGYTAALEAVAAAASPGDRVITVAPYHYHVPMNRFKARLPLIGLARQPEPLPETALPLLAYATAGDNTWLITVGFQPAAPDNAVERWLVFHDFKATDSWLPDEVRLVRYAAGRPAITRPSGVTLGAALQLLEARLPASFHVGQSLPVELLWLPLAQPGVDYSVFLQLLTAEGRLVAQHDSPPNGGYTPTSSWQPGQPVQSRHALAIPPGLAPGSYRLITGLYDPATGERLPAEGQADFIDLGRVELDE